MNFILWLIIGGILGWVASLIMHTNAQQGIFLNIVVGIIGAFQSIGSTGSGGLGAVSAGIAEALIVTAFGLVVAIPAVLFFNYLTSRINAVELSLERSAGELIDEMENEHGRSSQDRIKKAA